MVQKSNFCFSVLLFFLITSPTRHIINATNIVNINYDIETCTCKMCCTDLTLYQEKKSYLPLVKLKTRDNSSNNSTPRPSPPRGEAGSEQKMPQQPQLTTDTGSTLPGTRSLNSDSSVSSPKQTLVELSGAIKPPVKLGDCLESLMPRSLDTLNPEAIKKSNENTRKMISRLLVDVDLRLPQKDTMLSLEAKTEKEKLLKRITPKVKPMVSDESKVDIRLSIA